MSYDKETQEILTESEELRLLTKGRAWSIIRQRLVNRVIELSDILAIDEPDPTKLSMKLAVNREVIKILLEWLSGIESEKENINVQAMLKKEKEQTYISIIGD